MSNAANHRPIRSFVRREGRMTDAQKLALQELWPRFGLEFTGESIDFDRVFGRKAVRVLEIGFGMGKSFLADARKHLEQDFIGIEVHRPGVGALLIELEREHLGNVRIFCHDAVEVLQRAIADESIDKIQIFFPDPWPKQRHHKRRLIQAGFVDIIWQKLKPVGVLHLATDWENYAVAMMRVLSEHAGFKNLAGEGQFITADNRTLTKYEARGRRLGHQVWDLQFEKRYNKHF